MILAAHKSHPLSAVLLALPLMIGTSAHAENRHDYKTCNSQNTEHYTERHDDRSLDNQGSFIQIRNRSRQSSRVCKRSVVGIGYGTSKSLARSNAVQAWSREARRRYGRTYRLRDADVVSAIRCQYNGNEYRGKFSKRSKRFNMPGEAGNPNHNWNCSVNAKPCKTKTVSRPDYNEGFGWKRRLCKRYARKAVRQQRRNIRLGCEYQGRKWHRNFRRHVRQCLRTPMFRNFRTLMRHKRQLRRCR